MILSQDKIHDISQIVDNYKESYQIVGLTSGGFDPITFGHIRLLKDAVSLCSLLIVLVNDDQFLVNKKGYIFMPIADRLSIINEMLPGAYILPWYDGTQFINNAIKILKPKYLFKGGDRGPDNMVQCEIDACKEVGTEIVYGVGGYDKTCSSSWYVNNLLKQLGK